MTVRSPPPMDDHDAAIESSLRLKLDRGEPLDAEERGFLARHLVHDVLRLLDDVEHREELLVGGRLLHARLLATTSPTDA